MDVFVNLSVTDLLVIGLCFSMYSIIQNLKQVSFILVLIYMCDSTLATVLKGR